MTIPTEADREKAAELIFPRDRDARWGDVMDAVAAALAEEREKARAPFLALAEEWEGNAPETYVPGYRYVAGRIRRAAEVSE